MKRNIGEKKKILGSLKYVRLCRSRKKSLVECLCYILTQGPIGFNISN